MDVPIWIFKKEIFENVDPHTLLSFLPSVTLDENFNHDSTKNSDQTLEKCEAFLLCVFM